ncbi:MAG: RagB/SusD family nutrient uptake outer membrane protein [Flavobacteriaceae bacterium]|nr:RagB/SusD family nutrient uptake outer membrane protein [Flavobacteriaceae bacterium]
MKYTYKIIVLFIVLVIVSSCNDFLDTELEGTYTPDTFYKTEEHALKAINATYQIASFNSSKNNSWVFGDVASDDTVKGGGGGDQSDIGYINDFNVNPDNGAIETFWKHYYEGISRANKVIYYVAKIDMDPELRNRIIGEAKFLRAYYYYHLTNVFGSVPLKITPAFTAEELNVPLATVTDIYAQIELDLSEAKEVLPVSYKTPEKGRVTNAAALGLLSKVYLFQEKWQLALEATEEIEGQGYKLMDLYTQNFDVFNKNNKEAIFEIQHLTGQVPFSGSYLSQYFSPVKVNGYFFNAPTESFVNEFEVVSEGVVDPRLDYSVGREGTLWVDGKEFSPTWSPATGYLSKKHAQSSEDNSIGDGDLNYTFMRYAEVLLIKAEALNELSRGNEAVAFINALRKRARESYLYDVNLTGFGTVPNGLLPDITYTSQSQMKKVIRHERRVELGLEFHRFYDVMRYGATYAEEVLSDTQFIFENNRYFPIPQSERDTNTKI